MICHNGRPIGSMQSYPDKMGPWRIEYIGRPASGDVPLSLLSLPESSLIFTSLSLIVAPENDNFSHRTPMPGSPFSETGGTGQSAHATPSNSHRTGATDRESRGIMQSFPAESVFLLPVLTKLPAGRGRGIGGENPKPGFRRSCSVQPPATQPEFSEMTQQSPRADDGAVPGPDAECRFTGQNVRFWRGGRMRAHTEARGAEGQRKACVTSPAPSCPVRSNNAPRQASLPR